MDITSFGYASATPLDDNSPLPPGEYPVRVKFQEIRQYRSGTSYLSMHLQVTDGDFKGRIYFHKFNLWSASEKARDYAVRQLKSMAIAAGHPNPNGMRDTEELNGASFIAKLKIDHDEQYGDRNDLVACKPMRQAPAAAPAPAPAPSYQAPSFPAQAAPSEQAAMPWA